MMSSDQNLFVRTTSSWSRHLAAEGIVVDPLRTFGKGIRTARSVLVEILRSDVRVVILLANTPEAISVALDAHALQMTTTSWAWISLDFIPGAENSVADTIRETAKEALYGWLYTVPSRGDPQTMSGFYERVKAYGQQVRSTPQRTTIL